MFKKPKPEEVKKPEPQQIENQEFEEPALEVQHNEPKVKKPEVSTEPVEEEEEEMEDTEELTEEAVSKILQSLNYRISRIEHHLRLDY